MSVFRKGDVVYHTHAGKCTVVEVPDKLHCYVMWDVGTTWMQHISLLSFTPWPAPCHVRPIPDGVWVVHGSPKGAGDVPPMLRRLKDGNWYSVNSNYSCCSICVYNYAPDVIQRIAD